MWLEVVSDMPTSLVKGGGEYLVWVCLVAVVMVWVCSNGDLG